MPKPTDILPSTATQNVTYPTTQADTDGASILHSSHTLSALKAHVIAGVICVVVFIVLLVVAFMLFRRNQRISSHKGSTSLERVPARNTTGLAPQVSVVIVDKFKHGASRPEHSDPSRSKLNCKIKTDTLSPHSQRIKNPHPPSYSYYHMDGHYSPSSSSASSSFDETSPLDSTSYPFFDRSNAVFTREAPNVDRYCLRQPRPNSYSRSPTPTNLEALESFVACVDYEYQSDPPKAPETQSKSRVNGEPEKLETPCSATPKDLEGSLEQRMEERSSMIGRGESYYWKNPPRIRNP